MLDLLADLAISIGTICTKISDRRARQRGEWLDRAEFWSDAARWFRLRCVKPFAEIRAARKAVKS